ncbi:MAG: NAD-binding protein [archaeon]|nr:NAD-binding protein [archaeon]
MKVIIVGGGNVGLASAKSAVAGNDVHLIEKDAAAADLAKNTLAVSILKADASNPNVLRDAIDRIQPDILLSAVKDDGINIFICSNAKRIDSRIRTIACIRDPDFINDQGYEGVDVLISPDTISSEKMIKISLMENAVNYEELHIGDYCLVTYKIERGHDIVGRTVMSMTLPEDCTIVSIYRGERTITLVNTAEIHADDRIVVLCTWEGAKKFNKFIGIKKEAKEFVILGAGSQGLTIAKSICDESGKNFVKILDDDVQRCREASKHLKNAIVVNGNIVDPKFLDSENLDRADAIISVTNIDERNLLACMTALRFHIRKIVSRYSIEEYEGIFKYAGIESVVGYHKIISNEITKNLRSTSIASIYVMENPGDYFMSFILDDFSPMVGHLYGDLVIPEGVNLCAIVKDDTAVFPNMLTRFNKGDKVLLYIHDVEPLRLTGLLGKNCPEYTR